MGCNVTCIASEFNLPGLAISQVSLVELSSGGWVRIRGNRYWVVFLCVVQSR